MLQPNTSKKILDYCKQQKYPVGNFNIIYIEGVDLEGRLNSDAPNQFNDLRCIFDRHKCVDLWTATTEPGAYYTDHPLNPAGAFRIAFGYHHEAWEIGFHGYSEEHEALVQIAPIKGYRDYNRDGLRTGDNTVTGLFGINQHWGYDMSPDDIGTASAGCLVGRSRQGHQQFMRYCINSGLSRFSTIVLPGDKIFGK
jgi:hypothetical protein